MRRDLRIHGTRTHPPATGSRVGLATFMAQDARSTEMEADADAARAAELPQAVLVGLFPKSLKRLADCLVYSDRFVFLGLARKAIAKRAFGGGILTPAMFPLGVVSGGLGLGSAYADAEQAALLTPELAEAAEHARTVLFSDIVGVKFGYAYGRAYGITLELADGTKEKLLPGPQHTPKKAVQSCFAQVLPGLV